MKPLLTYCSFTPNGRRIFQQALFTWLFLIPTLLLAQVNLVLNPNSPNVQVGETFTVTVEVQAGTQLVDLAEVHLNFNPAIVQVTDLTPTGPLPASSLVPANFNNSNGRIDYAGATTGNFPSGTFNLLIIEFQALANGISALEFSSVFPRETIVTGQLSGGGSAGNVLSNALAGNIRVGTTNTTCPTPSIPGTIQAEAFTAKTADIVLENGGTTIGRIRQGYFTEYNICVEDACAYNISLLAASGANGGFVDFKIGNATLATVPVVYTGDWQTYISFTGTINLPAGNNTLRLEYRHPTNPNSTGFLINVDHITFTLGSDCSVCQNNNAPVVDITAPANNTSISTGSTLSFIATANDDRQGNLSSGIRWTSSIQGNLGSGNAISSTLVAGTHTISAAVTDDCGVSGSESITITVEDTDCVGQSIPGILEAEGFSNKTATIVLENNGTTIGAIRHGDFTEYLVCVQENCEYNLAVLAASNSSGGFIDIKSGTTTLATVRVPFTGGWQNYQTINESITLPAGSNTLRLEYRHPTDPTATSFLLNLNRITFTPSDDCGADECDDNTAPVVTITAPNNGTTTTVGTTTTFTATATDAEDGNLAANIQWSSSISGILGTGGSINATLAVGTHTIRAQVTDACGATDSKTITISVNPSNTAPTVTITAPNNNATFTEGTTVTFSGTATDPQDGNLSSSLIWTSSVDGNLGTGASITKANLTLGTHIITARATDSNGLSGQASITIQITAAPNNNPVVTIISPANNATFIQETSITFEATANDTEDGNLSAAIEWSSSRDGDLGTGGSITVADLSAGTHIITAEVSDEDGAGAMASIQITIGSGSTDCIAIPGVLEAEDFTDKSSSITVNTDNTGTYLNFIRNNTYSEYNVCIEEACTYNLQIVAASASPVGGRIDVKIGNTVLGSIKIGLTGGWQFFRIFKTAIALPEGEHTLRLEYFANATTNAGSPLFNFGKIIFGTGANCTNCSGNRAPAVILTAPANGTTISEGRALTFRALATDDKLGNISDDIVWSSSLTGELGTGEQLTTTLPAGAHLITAAATDDCNATGTAAIRVVVRTNLNDSEVSLSRNQVFSFQIAPNPGVDHLNIRLSEQWETNNIIIRVTDLQGQTLLQYASPAHDNNNIRLNAASLAPGMYLVNITSDDGYLETQKWIKQ